MAACVFDNPTTWTRECWQDGRLLVAYRFEILPGVAREPIPGRLFFFGANVGDWQPGRCWGDSLAMKEPQ